MTTLLALDTATEACSVALLHKGQVFSRYAVIPRLHAQRILPMIQDVLAEAGATKAEIEAIAFGRGPGAFTGLRIAVGVVQGLAFALQRPVLPVSNLAAIAQRAYREHGAEQVAVAIDARMGEIYWGCYKVQDGIHNVQGAEAVLTPERAELPRAAQGEWFAAGTGWQAYAEQIKLPVYASDEQLLPHAQDILQLAEKMWLRGEAISAQQAQPVYLRDQVATPKQSS
ncbi:MAG TPA: tRNA (adenosine(37)-N6)-threonylcarbamoyltransferase complex dimerization subunit type 1 TsaB [Thiopseudomonas sp.]|nr:tRNA (adenosine(37)-N6)-threonylcarbamoyltransferase complex dimerization subunit type 1 TsaB [Thiopseudomonas sp.]